MQAVARYPVAKSSQRLAFVYYLRTGRRVSAAAFVLQSLPHGLKFNPNHDPHNGQFTFGPGGGSLGGGGREAAIDRPDVTPIGFQRVQFNRPPPAAGGNSRAFQDPMLLEQVFPGHADAPAGSIVAVADDFLDLTGPGTRLTAELTKLKSQALIAEIRSIDPSYRFQSLGFPEAFEGQMNQLNGLRLDRARAYYVLRGDVRPLQFETLRFLQTRTDNAYKIGLHALKSGNLDIRLSPAEAVGNFVDRRVRNDLRALYRSLQIPTGGGAIVKVNSREYDTSGVDRTYRQPDARVGDVAFDVTLTRKTLSSTAQIRGFFASDFKPHSVVIVRPSQLGRGNTYVITRPVN